MIKSRNRGIYGILIIGVILLGLASRKFGVYLPNWLADYSGDTLWSLMVFLIIGFLFIKCKTKWVGFSALLFSFFIEISQLYHSRWIDMIRETKLGGLILGFGFLWTDLICYIVGILIGVLLEKRVKKLRRN